MGFFSGGPELVIAEHKGYSGRFEIDLEGGIIYGRVLDIKDVVTFQAETVRGAVEAFRESVDDYLAMCRERGEEPERPS